MPVFGFFGGNLSELAKRNSQLARKSKDKPGRTDSQYGFCDCVALSKLQIVVSLLQTRLLGSLMLSRTL